MFVTWLIYILSTVETQVSGGEDNMETIEAAEALLNMESPNNILDEKRMSMWWLTVCLHGAVILFCLEIFVGRLLKKPCIFQSVSTYWYHFSFQFCLCLNKQYYIHILILDLCPSVVHTYGNMLESELTYISLRPEQLSNGCMDVPLDEETSSLDEIPQKNLSKPARKSKGTIILQ